MDRKFMSPVRIAMSRRNTVIAIICLLISVAAPSWGSDPQLVASGKWDLWDDTGDSSKPDREQVETPADTRAETHAAPVQEPANAREIAKSDASQTANADAGRQPVAKAADVTPVADQNAKSAPGKVSGEQSSKTDGAHQPDSKTAEAVQAGHSELKDKDMGHTEKTASSEKSPASASTETDIKAKEDVAVAGSLADSAGSVATGTGAEYIIGAGDFLDVSVWKDEVLSRTVVVLTDGTISFPLIGKITAAGRTVNQVKDEIVKKLVRYYPEPEVNIEVKQSNSMLIYVIGRVNAPGRQVLNANIDVIQALAMAGGPNPFANRNKIKILRKEGGKTVALPFRYDDVIVGKIETNVELKRGDVIVVP